MRCALPLQSHLCRATTFVERCGMGFHVLAQTAMLGVERAQCVPEFVEVGSSALGFERCAALIGGKALFVEIVQSRAFDLGRLSGLRRRLRVLVPLRLPLGEFRLCSAQGLASVLVGFTQHRQLRLRVGEQYPQFLEALAIAVDVLGQLRMRALGLESCAFKLFASSLLCWICCSTRAISAPTR